MPQYQLRELCIYLPALEADEQQAAVSAAVVPLLKPASIKAMQKDLRARAKQLYPRNVAEPIEKIRHDPEAAAAWFAARGALVETPLTG